MIFCSASAVIWATAVAAAKIVSGVGVEVINTRVGNGVALGIGVAVTALVGSGVG